MGGAVSAEDSKKTHYEIHAPEFLERKEKQKVWKAALDLQVDGSLSISEVDHSISTFKIPKSPAATASPTKVKKEKSDLELQAQAHWHNILMHARNRDAEREKAQVRKLNKKQNEEDDAIFDIDPGIDKELMKEELIEEGHEDAGVASKSPVKKGNATSKSSYDDEDDNAAGHGKKKKKKHVVVEEEKKKFNPFDFIRGKLKKKIDQDIENEERGIAKSYGDEEEEGDDNDNDDANSKFSDGSDADDDLDEDAEGEYQIYKGELKIPEVMIQLKSRTQDSVTLNWDVDSNAMEILYEIQESLGYHFRPKYEVSYLLYEGGSPSPLSQWTIVTNTTRSHGGRIKGLEPHTAYAFRAKRVGWDNDYGQPVIIRTGPGPPGPPGELKIKEVTSTSILVTWAYPERDNGLPVLEYIVSMKAYGKEFEVVYRGKNKLFLATDLNSSIIYVFEVKAKNKAGESTDASKKVSVRTLPPGSPNMTPWIEFIDEKTEKVCYSHPSTGAVAWELPKGGFVDENESFRFKRMWLSRRMYFKSLAALEQLGKESHENKFNIDRSKMLEQSLQKIYSINPVDMDAGPVKIVFDNEEGIDAGGLGKDWFSQVAKLITQSSSGIFCVLPSGEVTIDPRSSAIMSTYELKWLFKAVGAFMAKAIIDGHTLGLFLNPLLLIYLVGDKPQYEDLEIIEPSYYAGLEYIKGNDVSEMEMTFTASYELFDEQQVVELKSNGKNELVTQVNKGEYCKLLVDWLIRRRFEPGLSYLLDGFHRNMLVKDISKFKPAQLQSILGGCQSIDPADIIKDARFAGGYEATSDQVIWLTNTIEGFDQLMMSKFLSFVTGCRSLPLDGLKPTLLITLWSGEDANDKTLPKAHTCFNQLVLPAYSRLEVLVERLEYALSNFSDGFFMS